MLNPNAVAGFRRALVARGTDVIVRRVSGVAPSAVTFDAAVVAIVTDYKPQSPVMKVDPEGAVTLGARSIIVLACDLAAANFPLPVAKNDKVVIAGEELNVMSVDPYTRSVSGAVEILAEGV